MTITTAELINRVNEAHLLSVHIDDEIDTGDAVFLGSVDPDEHRWYTIATHVYKVADGFVGIRGIARLKSESSDYSDICTESVAFEMEEVPSVTYKRKS